MPLSPEDRKLVDRRLKALDAQPAFQKLVEEARAERLQRRQAELQGPSSPPRHADATLEALSRPYPLAEERWLGLESPSAPASAPPARESPTG